MKETVFHSTVKKFDIVKRVVSRYYKITEWELAHGGRLQKFVRPRKMAMYLCKKLYIGDIYSIAESFSFGYDRTRRSIADMEMLLTKNRWKEGTAFKEMYDRCDTDIQGYKKLGIIK